MFENPYVDPRAAFDTENIRIDVRGSLPENYTDLEYDILAVTHRVGNIPIELDKLVEPLQTSANILPFLAWEYSTNLWYDDWTEKRRRAIVADSHRLHSLKGTLAGIRAHLDYVDVPLVRAVTPPGTCFAGASLTKEQRAEFLSVMPQLRLYAHKDKASGKGKVFAGTRSAIAGRMCMPLSDAAARVGVLAFYYDQGVLTPLLKEQITTKQVFGTAQQSYTVRLRGNGTGAFFCGQCVVKGKTILGKPKSVGTAYSFTFAQDYSYAQDSLALTAVKASFDPATVRFDLVKETARAKGSSLYPRNRTQYDFRTRQFLVKKFLPPSTAGDRIYKRIYLWDASRGLTKRNAQTFCGSMRLSVPAYTAILSVAVVNTKPKRAFSRFPGGTLVKTPSTKLDRARQAVLVSKAERDKVLLRIGVYKIPAIEDGIPLDGSYQLGQAVREDRR